MTRAPWVADERVAFASPDPARVYCYTPALLPLGADGGGGAERLVASFDLGGEGVADLGGPVSRYGDFGRGNQCRAMVSDDGGGKWRETARLPMLHALLFSAGGALYLLGTDKRLLISRSDDGGETWSALAVLDDERPWDGGGGRIDFHNGQLYLLYEEHIDDAFDWPNCYLRLLAAPVEAGVDLRDKRFWRMSAPFDTRPLALNGNAGVPFWPRGELTPGAADGRFCGTPGALEGNVVRVYDPRHVFYDPAGRDMLLFMRAHSGGNGNLGAVLKATDHADGALEIAPLTTPAGALLHYVPLPGGQMKFHIIHDAVSGLYWMVSTQCTDCLTRPEHLPPERYGIPDNERRRLQLHFSRNAFNWCYAGMVALGPEGERSSRHYANMAVVGRDLLILARSGDARAHSAHNGNLLTLHRVRDFRSLAF